jgi:hypothetical protein
MNDDDLFLVLQCVKNPPKLQQLVTKSHSYELSVPLDYRRDASMPYICSYKVTI